MQREVCVCVWVSLGGERESKGQHFRAGGKTKRESDYSSHSTSHLPLSIFLKISLWKSPCVHRGCATSADLQRALFFHIHDTRSPHTKMGCDVNSIVQTFKTVVDYIQYMRNGIFLIWFSFRMLQLKKGHLKKGIWSKYDRENTDWGCWRG